MRGHVGRKQKLIFCPKRGKKICWIPFTDMGHVKLYLTNVEHGSAVTFSRSPALSSLLLSAVLGWAVPSPFSSGPPTSAATVGGTLRLLCNLGLEWGRGDDTPVKQRCSCPAHPSTARTASQGLPKPLLLQWGDKRLPVSKLYTCHPYACLTLGGLT